MFSFLTNREYLELLVTQPISRGRVLLGKYVGLSLTVIGASALGFGLPGVVIAIVIGAEGAAKYLLVVVYSCLLAMVFTGLSVLIAVLSKRRQIALGVALAVWIFYEVLYGVLMLGTSLYLSPKVLRTTLLAGLLANPIDTTRVLSLLQVGGPHLFGPAGATLIKLTGSVNVATIFGLGALAAWIVIPVVVAIIVFRRQNLA